MILAVGRNDKTFILATEIDLSASASDGVAKPDKGKQMTRAKFAQAVMEKTEDFKNAAAAKKRDAVGKGSFKKGED